MKILFVHTDLRLYWPARLRALKKYTESVGWDLQVVEIAEDGSLYSFADKFSCTEPFWHCLFPNQRIEEIPSSVAAKRLYLFLNSQDPDIVFAGSIAYTSGAVAVRWAKENRRRVVIFDDVRPQDVKRNGLVNWVKRRIYSNVDAMLVPAPSHSPGFEEWGVPVERIFFGVDVVDNDFFTDKAFEAKHELKRIRCSLGVPPRFLLGVGRQVVKKNWNSLLEAWALFCSANPSSDLGLVLVGEGPERKQLTSMSECLAIPRLQLHNFVEPEILAQYYACALGFILPSKYGETWGLVVNEAMAASLPVLVSSECGCCDTLVKDGDNGWRFSPHDCQMLAAIIQELDTLLLKERQKMGKRSHDLISDWGLDRFCSGAADAIRCAQQLSMRKGNSIDSLLLRLWRGRYRPT